MSVTVTTSKVQYTLSSGGQVLPVPFYFIESSHLKLIRARAGVADLVLTLNTDYTVTGAGDESGGTVTTIAGTTADLDAGDVITIKRSVPNTQLVNYVYNDKFPAEVHERALDRLTMLAQQTAEVVSRAVQFPESEVAGTGNIMPNAADRAAKILGFDASGNAVQLYDPVSAVFAQGDAIYANSVAALKAVTVGALLNGQQCHVAGYSTPGDGGGGTWVYVSASAATESVGTIVAPNAGTGRWLRVFSGLANVKWWGAKGDGITDDAAAIQAAITWAQGSTLANSVAKGLFIPEGQYLIGSTLTVAGIIAIVGESGEVNPADIVSYALRGTTLKSAITDGTPVLKLTGQLAGGRTYLNTVILRDFNIDGTGTDGDGIWAATTGALYDLHWERLMVRNVGGSAFKVGDGTASSSTNNTGFHYSRFNKLSAIKPKKDGFWFSGGNQTSVGNVFRDLYCNDAGRNSFHWQIGGFVAENLVENNAAQLEAGSGFRLHNVRESTFIKCVAEGPGRLDESGYSTTPTGFTAYGFDLYGCRNSVFINCVATSAAGDGANTSGQFHFRASVAAGGYSVVYSEHNKFINCRSTNFYGPTVQPSGALAGAAGNVDNGVHLYRVTCVYSGGWETPITSSRDRSVTVTDKTVDGQVSLTNIPLGGALGPQTCTSRKIYRTVAGGSEYKLLATIADNTTTVYTDNTADAGLGATKTGVQHFYFAADMTNNSLDPIQVSTQPEVVDTTGKNWFFNLFQEDTNPQTGGFRSFKAGDALPFINIGMNMTGTTAASSVPRMTSTQRDALTASNGMTIYNTTTDKFQGRAAGAWVDLH